MKVSLSDLSFAGFRYKELAQLPKEYGLEFFYEFGKDDYWDTVLPDLLEGRQGLSMHGPCVSVNLADENDERYLTIFEETLAYAKKIKAEFVVVHTNESYSGDLAICKQRVIARLHNLEELALAYGVRVVIENVGLRVNGSLLFDYEEFCELTEIFFNFGVLIDTGHAHVNGWDLPAVIQRLGKRIVALHLHDNDGTADSHLPIGRGSIAWAPVFAAIKEFTPEATLVLEYANVEMSFVNKQLEELKKTYL